MDQTPRLGLPNIAAQQGLRQVTFNEAMAVLERIVQPAVLSRTPTVPPTAPLEGDAHLVPPAAAGAWAGAEGAIAQFRDGAWHFSHPRPGWLVFVRDEEALLVFTETGWQVFFSTGPAGLPSLGINTAPDATNRLALRGPASLFAHDGTDHRLMIDKAGPADTASLVFQSGASGRAEIGLSGSDDLSVKLSADGSAWSEALRLSDEGVMLGAGRLGFPATPAPSADPNVLDAYAEGSFTPSVSFGNASVGVVHGSQNAGRYTRIGRLCFVSGTLHLSQRGTSTGAARLTGLPFAAAPGTIWTTMSVGYSTSFAVVGALQGIIGPNATEIVLYQTNGGASSAVQHSNFTNTTLIYFSLTYELP
ncbi:DUF2793 domain-containing protein [Arsenicitalea aurantiaca]|uniref:DUF2793 domain-containing protein n=1 Tax=Arsenicitalea aurantiaca TaxID=1783274 RepID=A0A433X7Q1_9HYPH|nr:DUF2793 domain-containing protein [Arsenicitalea aurantiaca]RUT30117.1 DUF2793 domain-containing protein [Arsenicitalea aurantiaca]